jgi:flagellum-specific peptidoglycan hydrolase FlgJ
MAAYHLSQAPQPTSIAKELLQWFGKYWFQLVMAGFVWQLYTNREVKSSSVIMEPLAVQTSMKTEKLNASFPEEPAFPSIFNEDRPSKATVKSWKSSDFKNLSFVFDPEMANRKGVDVAIVKEKNTACRKYVERFAATAMAEMKQFGIPASITLAQGLLETDAGGSKLATDSNNHFGIKCRSKCRHCTCRNYSDDDVYDMFRVFDSAWESFREHSKLLQIDRYKHLKKLGTTDYEGWAKGLKKAGYATDKNYDKKLVQIIEELDLHQFDK